jgi:hypothetical protein
MRKRAQTRLVVARTQCAAEAEDTRSGPFFYCKLLIDNSHYLRMGRLAPIASSLVRSG